MEISSFDFVKFLDRWQTLIAGGAAILGAAFVFITTKMQLAAMERQQRRLEVVQFSPRIKLFREMLREVDIGLHSVIYQQYESFLNSGVEGTDELFNSIIVYYAKSSTVIIRFMNASFLLLNDEMYGYQKDAFKSKEEWSEYWNKNRIEHEKHFKTILVYVTKSLQTHPFYLDKQRQQRLALRRIDKWSSAVTRRLRGSLDQSIFET